MKKVLKQILIQKGMPTTLTIEYRYRWFLITIPITYIITVVIERQTSSEKLELTIKDLLK